MGHLGKRQSLFGVILKSPLYAAIQALSHIAVLALLRFPDIEVIVLPHFFAMPHILASIPAIASSCYHLHQPPCIDSILLFWPSPTFPNFAFQRL